VVFKLRLTNLPGIEHAPCDRKLPHPSYTQQHTTTLHKSTWVHKTTNVPVVFMARYVMILRGATSLLGALEGVRSCLFRAQKSLDFQGPSLPMPLVMMLHPSKSLLPGHKNNRYINSYNVL
jgi:hypothetical protein